MGFADDKAAVKLSDKRRRRHRAERIAVIKAAKAEEGRLLVQTAAKAEAVQSAKAAQELKINAMRPDRQGFVGAPRCR